MIATENAGRYSQLPRGGGHTGPRGARDKPWRWPEAEEGGAASGAFLAVSPGRNGLGLASLNDFGSLWGRGDCP